MSVIGLLVILLILAGLYWLVNVKFAAAVTGPFKWLINLVLIVVAVIIVLVAFGVWDEAKSIKVPKI